MISSYRLGDLVFRHLKQDERDELFREHPNTIGGKYILENKDSIDVITKIVLEHIEQNIDHFPKDISDSTVIHLRLGDVIAGNTWHEKSKRPLDVNHIKSLVSNNADKKYVIGKIFFAKTSSVNYEDCTNKSNEYLQNIINELQAEYFNSGDSDIDLCCAVKAKLFIQGKGFFSKLIVEIRKKLNLNSIETTTYDV
jgi:hypothetical protein